MADFDVVIVGAGHNGLTAGCYLAQAGRRVAIVERMGKVGGMTSSGYMIPEAPQHLVTPCAIEVIFMRATDIMETLQLSKHGWRAAEPDPSYVYLDPDGGSIALFRDPERTAEDIARFSRADGKAYREFNKLLDALFDIGLPMLRGDPARMKLGDMAAMGVAAIRNNRLREELTLLTKATSHQIAAEWFEHPATAAFLTGIAAGAGPIDVDGNAAAYMLIAMLHRVGVARPIGSMQTLSNALAGAFTERKGTILLDAPVAEILIEGDRARGVRLEDGRVLTADVVVATCDPHVAYGLTTPGGIPRRMMARMEHAPSGRGNMAPFLANIAMSGKLRLKKHQDMRHDGADLSGAVGLIGSAADVQALFEAAAAGEVPERPALSLSPVTGWDPSQAPDGGSLAYIYLPVSPVAARGGWPNVRDAAMSRILAHASEYYDGLDTEVGRFVETPQDRATRMNVTNGCVVHIDFAGTRNGLDRPAPGLGGAKPVVPGFFLGGASTHPGGGVSGLAGKIAAERVDNYLRKQGRSPAARP